VVIDIFSDLLGFPVLFEESSEDSLPSHPEDLGWHSGVLGSLPLTVAGVSALPLGLVVSSDSGSGVHVHLSPHDEAILIELFDVLS